MGEMGEGERASGWKKTKEEEWGMTKREESLSEWVEVKK